ncbi:hypothetical protein [Streptomyces adustus]|nr:hypothetical protein [Streptomyces adustus]
MTPPERRRSGHGPAYLRALAAYTSPSFTPEARPALEGSIR